MKTLAFFNPKSGLGKTWLVYHLAWMFADRGLRVLAADLDPQADLTTMFLEGDALEALWPEGVPGRTLFAPFSRLVEGEGVIADPHVEAIEDSEGIGLLAGDLALAVFEDELSHQWASCLDGKDWAFHATGAFHMILERAGRLHEADLVLIDVGPNLGAINRAALIAADHVAILVAPDLLSLQGLQTFGPRLREWRRGWTERLEKRPTEMDLPQGRMNPLGYVAMQHPARLDRPKPYAKWMAQIPATYREAVLGEAIPQTVVPLNQDSQCVSTLKPYRSLMSLAQEARKPMFLLRPADGAIGSHATAVHACYRDYSALAIEIAGRMGVTLR